MKAAFVRLFGLTMSLLSAFVLLVAPLHAAGAERGGREERKVEKRERPQDRRAPESLGEKRRDQRERSVERSRERATAERKPSGAEMSRRDAAKVAQGLGYRQVKGERLHGQEIYKKGNTYISRDVDSHKGGGWKMFERRGGNYFRTGTYDRSLSKKIGA